ncbi:3'-5' exonuclease [Conexibacter sp. W3-3-2]|uniref:3'-5' exonuclease n=1 Tax=Conexibacter sp. W3-3-2 TaxID=2675227 RepID=UPI0035C8F9C5
MTLSTIHAAKGREWPVVIVYGASDCELPHRRSVQEATPGLDGPYGLEDERRLAYVAFTRARRELLVLCDRQEPISRFCAEADLPTHDRQAARLSPTPPRRPRLPQHWLVPQAPTQRAEAPHACSSEPRSGRPGRSGGRTTDDLPPGALWSPHPTRPATTRRHGHRPRGSRARPRGSRRRYPMHRP